MKIKTAKEYLEAYYSTMDEENISIVEFIKFIPCKGISLFDYGCGANMMLTASIHDRFEKIFFGDADERLTDETLRFKFHKETFNWSPVFSYLNVEVETFRKKINNIYLTQFPATLPQQYDTILCFFCLDMASRNWKEFNYFYQSLLNHVSPNGWLIIGVVTESYAFVPGENDYPCLNITKDKFLQYHTPMIFETIPACADRGYKGMLFSAEKP